MLSSLVQCIKWEVSFCCQILLDQEGILERVSCPHWCFTGDSHQLRWQSLDDRSTHTRLFFYSVVSSTVGCAHSWCNSTRCLDPSWNRTSSRPSSGSGTYVLFSNLRTSVDSLLGSHFAGQCILSHAVFTVGGFPVEQKNCPARWLPRKTSVWELVLCKWQTCKYVLALFFSLTTSWRKRVFLFFSQHVEIPEWGRQPTFHHHQYSTNPSSFNIKPQIYWALCTLRDWRPPAMFCPSEVLVCHHSHIGENVTFDPVCDP